MSMEPVLQHPPVRTLPVAAANNDEIDLRLLLLQLWQEKKTVVAFVFVAAILSLAVAFMLPQKWTSQSVVTIPETLQVNELDRVVLQLQTLGVDAKHDRGSVFNLFIKKLSSQTEFREWLSKSGLVTDETDPVALHREIVNMAEKLTITNNANPKQPEEQLPYISWTVAFSDKTAEQAQKILRGYIDYTSQQVRQEVLDTLRNTVDRKIRTEQESIQLERTHLEIARNVLLKRLQYALNIANAAGIQKPLSSQGATVHDDPDFSISLGAEGLAEKLKIESSLKDVSDLNSALQSREFTLGKLQELKIPDVSFMPVAYQLSPSLPIKKDGPGKALILVLGCLLGGLLGCGFVLGRQMFRA